MSLFDILKKERKQEKKEVLDIEPKKVTVDLSRINSKLEYKGYTTSVEYNLENDLYYGKVEGITDPVLFRSLTSDKIVEEFHKAVDGYLAKAPELSFRDRVLKDWDYLKNAKNPLEFISKIDDCDIIVRAFVKAFDDENEEKSLSGDAQRLIWIIFAYLRVAANHEERTFDSVLKILKKACEPSSSREVKTTFDIMVEDITSSDVLKEKYEYFKYRVFGTYSNCYKKVVEECIEAFSVVSAAKVLEVLFEYIHDENFEENKKHLFGKLTKYSGQQLQIELCEKYVSAVHEAGHAVAFYLLNVDFEGVNIISADNRGGMVRPSNREGVDISNNAIIDYAGIIAEKVLSPHGTSSFWGGYTDSLLATKAVKNEIITKFSEPGEAQKYVYINADELGLANGESPYIVYETIKKCVELREKAVELISANKDLVEALANELLVKKSMAGEEVVAFLDEVSNARSVANAE